MYSVRKSTEYDGNVRTLFHLFCYNCKKDFYVPAHIIGKSKYCSRACSDKGRRRLVSVMCRGCEKEIFKKPSQLLKSKHKLYFCSRLCKDSSQKLGGVLEIQPPHYGTANGKYDYRKRAFKKYGLVCINCNYKKDDRMLDVDHIDGNRENNKVENLQVLCVWCHAQKTRKHWPSLNMGGLVYSGKHVVCNDK